MSQSATAQSTPSPVAQVTPLRGEGQGQVTPLRAPEGEAPKPAAVPAPVPTPAPATPVPAAPAAAVPTARPARVGRAVLRSILLVAIPIVALVLGTMYWLTGGRYIGTD